MTNLVTRFSALASVHCDACDAYDADAYASRDRGDAYGYLSDKPKAVADCNRLAVSDGLGGTHVYLLASDALASACCKAYNDAVNACIA